MEEFENLRGKIIEEQLTLVTSERFDMVLRYKEYLDKLSGDIVECGVWKGGMSIFLSKVFEDKKIWVCDSFEGCQGPSDGLYFFEGESHFSGQYAIPLETVKNNFQLFGSLDENRISFLKGWVKDTLKEDVCPINSISLLRIDVDSYSATLEVLDFLYDKLVPNGLIIFDDSCLLETRSAMKTFIERGNKLVILHPITEEELNIDEDLPCGCFCFKPE